MTLDHLPELVAACFSGLWVRTHEPEEAERRVQRLATTHNWKALAWDCARGIRDLATGDTLHSAATVPEAVKNCPWPPAAGGQAEDGPQPCLLLLHNLHRYSDLAPVAQLLQNEVLKGRGLRRFLVAVGPVVKLPPELEKLFTVVDFSLPDEGELDRIARELADPDRLNVGDPAPAARAAKGLTRIEAENAFTLALARLQRFDAPTVWDLKAQALEKTGCLTLHRGPERFADLGGLASLKAFCGLALGSARGPGGPKERAKGVMLLGVPGTGKSAFCKALGNEAGRPTLQFDVGAVFSKYVGESEQNLRAALAVADAMAPCVLFVDEVEKALGGAAQGGGRDSGVGQRLFGTLLTYLNDHTSDVFVVVTANDVRALPPEFARAERFDGTFFVDLPGREEKDAIWRMYEARYGLVGGSPEDRPDDADWTGAEIRACCRLADLLGVPRAMAAEYVVPVAASARDRIDSLREWASDRCLHAGRPGRYRKPTADPTPGRPSRRAVKVG